MRPTRTLRIAVLAALLLAGTTVAVAQAPQLSPEQRQQIGALEQQVRAAFEQKNYAAAEEALRKQIAILPTENSFHYNLACALSQQGKVADGLASLRKSIELGFHDIAHITTDPDLENLRKDDGWAAVLGLATKAQEDALAGTYDEGETIEGVTTVEGTPEGGLRYRLHLPLEASKEKPARLIVWLHPSGGSMNDVVEKLAPRFAEKGFALLVPTEKQWRSWQEIEARRLMEVTIPAVGRRADVDAKKPVLLGFSAGGQMAIEMWAQGPGRFGGLIVDAAYPLDIQAYRSERKAIPRPLPDDAAVKQVPIYAIVGDMDGGSMVWRLAEDRWRGEGVPLKIDYVAGRKHEWLIDDARLATVLEWLGKLPVDAGAAD